MRTDLMGYSGTARHFRRTSLGCVVLFHPAVATDLAELMGPEPFSPRARQARKAELRRMLFGFLAPEGAARPP